MESDSVKEELPRQPARAWFPGQTPSGDLSPGRCSVASISVTALAGSCALVSLMRGEAASCLQDLLFGLFLGPVWSLSAYAEMSCDVLHMCWHDVCTMTQC